MIDAVFVRFLFLTSSNVARWPAGGRDGPTRGAGSAPDWDWPRCSSPDPPSSLRLGAGLGDPPIAAGLKKWKIHFYPWSIYGFYTVKFMGIIYGYYMVNDG